jgi:hypothetical protein
VRRQTTPRRRAPMTEEQATAHGFPPSTAVVTYGRMQRAVAPTALRSHG